LRIYFGVNGIGLGHAGRCIPIAKKLSKNNEILFSTYGDAVEYIKKESFPYVKAPSIKFVVKPDGSVDFRQTAINPGPFFSSFTLMKQIEAEIKFMRAFKPNIVVSDSRISPLLAAKSLKIPSLCILNQFQIIIPRRTKFLRLAKLVDTGALAMIGKIWTSGAAPLIIPDFPYPYTLSSGNLNIPRAYQKRVKLIGPILPIHPKELPRKKILRKNLNLDEDRPFIFVPISGPIKERIYITNVLQKILKSFPKNYQIVVSLGRPNVKKRITQYDNLKIYDWIPNRFDYLKSCDLVISRAGHGTITQSLSFGKPMVLIPTPNHTEQLNNANKVKELGLARVVKQKNIKKSTLFTAVKRMLVEDKSEINKEIKEKTSGLKGLETAIAIILETALG
jgi:uncharacterized protein (TIGR00661 family)